MVPLIRLDELSKTWTHFGLVAVVVGMEDARPIVWSDGREALVRTLYLQDGSGEPAVELSLWDSDCVRASAIRVLDVVHVTEAGKTSRTKPSTGANSGNRAVAPDYNVRISLRGPTAAVRLVSDAVASAPCDDVSRAASEAKNWRDVQFKLVSSLQRRGAVWTHDSPGHGRRLRRPRVLAVVRDDAMRDNMNIPDRKSRDRTDASSEKVVQNGERVLLDDVRYGRCPAPAEVSNVCISHVLVQMPRTRQVASGCTVTARALQLGCSRQCRICGFAERGDIKPPEERRELCENCGGQIVWKFAPVAVVLKDESCEVVCLVTGDDVSHLLLGVQPSALKHDQQLANWCASILHALVADAGPFTALVAAPTDDIDLQGADLILKRLFV